MEAAKSLNLSPQEWLQVLIDLFPDSKYPPAEKIYHVNWLPGRKSPDDSNVVKESDPRRVLP